jgi:FtsP/CotA-like multicopper oxidase with cupredoxin domain
VDSGYKLAAVLGALLGLGGLLVATAALTGGGGAEGSAAAAAREQTVDVELGDLFIRPATLATDEDASVVIRVRNSGAIDHDLTVEGGPKTPLIKPGGTAELRLPAGHGPANLLCSVPGHAAAGMRAALVIGEQPSDAVHAAHAPMDPAKMDELYMAGVKAFPASTKGLGNQPLAPRVEGGVKIFELTASELEWEVSPGEFKRGLAYNEQIPGPLIRVQIGDRVRVVLHNRMPESTAIHFHGQLVPNAQDGVPGLTQPLVKSGESWTYEFTVRNAGSHMYHSHMNGAAQIPGGLLGAFIVEDPAQPIPEPRDEVMVLNDGPLGYTINGKGFPATHPLSLRLGERVRIRYMNEGLQIHPMHLHGVTQTVVARDGYALPQPYQADTILVAPGERVDVVVQADEPGLWALHCHILTHAETEEGMFGMVTVVIVE